MSDFFVGMKIFFIVVMVFSPQSYFLLKLNNGKLAWCMSYGFLVRGHCGHVWIPMVWIFCLKLLSSPWYWKDCAEFMTFFCVKISLWETWFVSLWSCKIPFKVLFFFKLFFVWKRLFGVMGFKKIWLWSCVKHKSILFFPKF